MGVKNCSPFSSISIRIPIIVNGILSIADSNYYALTIIEQLDFNW